MAPGRERDFERWVEALLRVARRFPGFLGAGILRPGSVGQDWHVVYRFATHADSRRWEESPTRAAWLREADDFVQETKVQRVSGLETWFELPGRTAPAPPRWKMALVTTSALVPQVILMNALVVPRLEGWPTVLRTIVFTGTLTSAMTWVVMPWLTRRLERFLYGRPSRARESTQR